jgi:hypothetical protein
MPKKTILKIFAVLAVLAIAFASFTTLGGDDTVLESAPFPFSLPNYTPPGAAAAYFELPFHERGGGKSARKSSRKAKKSSRKYRKISRK